MADTIAGNTSTSSTLAIGGSEYSSIDFPGDTDWWRVQLSAGYEYQIWLEGLEAGRGTLADPFLAVYNAAGVYQLGFDDISLLFNKDAYGRIAPSTTGTYYLSAEEYGHDAVGSYQITLWQDAIATTATAAYMAVNSTNWGRIGWQDDQSDWIAVQLVAGTNYQFDLVGAAFDGVSSGYSLNDPWLALRGSNGALIASDDDSGFGLNSRLYLTPTTSGTYFLDIQESGNNAAGTYMVAVNAPSVVGALAFGTPRADTIEFIGDVDLFDLTLAAGTPYYFMVNGSTLSSPFLDILNANGVSLHQSVGNIVRDSTSSYLTFTPATTGTYFVEVRAAGFVDTGDYSVRAGTWVVPSVSIADAVLVEGDSGTKDLVFTLTLSAASPLPVTVVASTWGTGTATPLLDYTPSASTVQFAPFATSATLSIPIRGDGELESTETLHVLLSSPSGAVLGDADAYGWIEDNDFGDAVPSEPDVPLQWHLYPATGINVFPVWPDYTGAGVRVAVFDQGIDASHPDLDGNLSLAQSRNASNLSLGGAPLLATDNHGTAVAGTIAAERNEIGGVGVAYDADLVSIYSPLALTQMAGHIPNAYAYATSADVLNDSWGFANGFSRDLTWAFYDNFEQPAFAASGIALANLANVGRNGLGTVVIQSAGNSFDVGDDTNLHSFQNSQYVITTAATTYYGDVSGYSSPGASILVAAPGGDGYVDGMFEPTRNIYTTDRVGNAGYGPGDSVYQAGTSFAAPIVSGIVALMLEANPGLGYRDAQEILAYSSRETSPFDNTWKSNGASNWNGGGLHYDADEHNLGFGLVDARAAVRLAETWSGPAHTVANRQQLAAGRNPNLSIPDNTGASALDSIVIAQALDIERVEVELDISHTFIGDLEIVLTSPSGTKSVLLSRPQQNPLSAFGTSQNDIDFTFNSVLSWGENSVGTWTLRVTDRAFADSGVLNSWTLHLIGKAPSEDDTYFFTDEYSEAVVGELGRQTLEDTSGIDTLNAAAVTGAVVLNLFPGGVSTIDGKVLNLAAGTVIERAFGGDGDDSITGSNAANVFIGMRGNDRLDGGGGLDIADYSRAVSAVTAELWRSSASNDGYGGRDVLLNIEGLIGSAFADLLAGSAGNDSLSGGAGNDGLYAADGQDTLIGGPGNDTLDGGTGQDLADYSAATGPVTAELWRSYALNDGQGGQDALWNIERLIGSAFADLLAGGTGNESFAGGAGNDGIYAAGGNDTLAGGAGRDTLDGGPGFDTADYSAATSAVTAELWRSFALNDGQGSQDALWNIERLVGSPFADLLAGGAGNESFSGGAGNDGIYAAGGNDTLMGGAGVDTLDGGAGIDTADYSSAPNAVTAELWRSFALNDGNGAQDALWNIESLIGSAQGDLLAGGANAESFQGGAGNDGIYAAAGNDTLAGGSGNDTLDGGPGIDTVDYSAASGAVTAELWRSYALNDGQGGQDALWNIESLLGSAFNDLLAGSNGDNLLRGQGGADQIYAAAGNDTLAGGAGNDILNGGPGADVFLFDLVLGVNDLDTVQDFSVADDTIQMAASAYASLGAPGALAVGFLRAGAGFTTAADANDYLIYNSTTGALYYDPDGTGFFATTQFAVLGAGLALTVADFVVV